MWEQEQRGAVDDAAVRLASRPRRRAIPNRVRVHRLCQLLFPCACGWNGRALNVLTPHRR